MQFDSYSSCSVACFFVMQFYSVIVDIYNFLFASWLYSLIALQYPSSDLHNQYMMTIELNTSVCMFLHCSNLLLHAIHCNQIVANHLCFYV